MDGPGHRPHAPDAPEGAGIRIIATGPTPASSRRAWGGVALLAVVVGAAGWGWQASRAQAQSPATGAVPAAVARTPAAVADGASAVPLANTMRRQVATPVDAEPLPGADSSDLASYFKPGDPEPTGREVIETLQQAGIRTGLGAFNPPGTSPPLAGLAVPATFALPAGYVRHHQVTDDGVPLEPILMFAPGFALRDADGRALPMPADRVVPPGMAPPGLPLRRISLPARP